MSKRLTCNHVKIEKWKIFLTLTSTVKPNIYNNCGFYFPDKLYSNVLMRETANLKKLTEKVSIKKMTLIRFGKVIV